MEDNKYQLAFEVMDVLAKAMEGASYSLVVNQKRYGYFRKNCVLKFNGKTFKASGEDCILMVMKEAVIYCINTYSSLADLRPEMEAILAEQMKGQKCEPSYFKIKIFEDAKD